MLGSSPNTNAVLPAGSGTLVTITFEPLTSSGQISINGISVSSSLGLLTVEQSSLESVLTYTDQCGVLNGDNSTCTDCAGVVNGTAVEDDCGNCGGDCEIITEGSCDCPEWDTMTDLSWVTDFETCSSLSCLSFAPGVWTDPFISCSSSQNNEVIADCNGVCDGEAVIDECGVCGGDGSSCVLWGETAFDIANTTEIYCSNFDTEGLEIPSNIGDLDNLEEIHCENAGLFGSIPWSLNGNLSNLTYINFKQNSLSGNITGHPFWNVPNLESLYLSQNNLTGSIRDIDHLDNIEIFWVSSNQLSGSIPPEIGNLQNLREFRVDGNQLTGNIPAEFGNLTTLQNTISLNDNLLY